MKRVALAEVKDHLSEYLDGAAEEEVIITRHGRPAGVLIGFATEDDWFDYRLEHDPRFLARVARARAGLRAGAGVSWDKVQADAGSEPDEFVVSDRPARRVPQRAVRKRRV